MKILKLIWNIIQILIYFPIMVIAVSVVSVFVLIFLLQDSSVNEPFIKYFDKYPELSPENILSDPLVLSFIIIVSGVLLGLLWKWDAEDNEKEEKKDDENDLETSEVEQLKKRIKILESEKKWAGKGNIGCGSIILLALFVWFIIIALPFAGFYD